MRVLILYNEALLSADDPDAASERGVLASVEAVREGLAAGGHAVERLALGRSIDPLLEAARSAARPEVVVNFCEGFAGDPSLESQVVSLLELLRLPYSGASAETLWLTRDKARTKFLLSAAGLPAPAGWRVVARHSLPTDAELAEHCIVGKLGTGPWFVKPAGQDASLGIGPESVVTERSALRAQIARVRSRYGDVLVEPYLAGREFNVSVTDVFEFKGGKPRVLPLAEINFQHDPDRRWPIVTYDAKWSPDSSHWGSTPVTCPAEVESKLAERLRECAAATFLELGCRHYARVDFRIDASGDPWILEVNCNPDLDPAAGFARSLQAAGVDYGEFACRLVEAAARRV